MHASDVLRQTRPGFFAPLDHASSFILQHGWAASTTRHYAAAVNKFFLFTAGSGLQTFPATANAIYQFICWCRENEDNKTVLSTTTKRYLTGLRMWHVLHNATFPEVNDHRIRLLLKAAKVTEIAPKPSRTGISLGDLDKIVSHLTGQNPVNRVLTAVFLVGFWGLARLGELTLNLDHPDVFIRRRDVSFNKDRTHATILLRMAKTAAPGEHQFLRLSKQPNRLDPCSALEIILNRIPGVPNDPLFKDPASGAPIQRIKIVDVLNKFKQGEGLTLSGHSLRIGGASLKAHLGCSIKSLQRSGRWKSSCYKLYVRPYSAAEAEATRVLARKLRKIGAV